MAKVSSKGKGSRSAGAGQFVTASFATKHPSTTVGDTRGEGGAHGEHRNAKTGEFLTTARPASHSKATLHNNKLEQIEKSIAALPDHELKELAAWFDDLLWDRQIEDDSKAGRLDGFAEEALADFRAGRTKPL